MAMTKDELIGAIKELSVIDLADLVKVAKSLEPYEGGRSGRE